MRALRGFAVDTSVICYRTLKNGIEVVRVLYTSRDIPPLF
jgi:plasmid stabilization system protein ParE